MMTPPGLLEASPEQLALVVVAGALVVPLGPEQYIISLLSSKILLKNKVRTKKNYNLRFKPEVAREVPCPVVG